ncbi:MAG: hypothetical protein GY788_01210 [bacterium]|nr:hypothetical protein [bacterium]
MWHGLVPEDHNLWGWLGRVLNSLLLLNSQRSVRMHRNSFRDRSLGVSRAVRGALAATVALLKLASILVSSLAAVA